MTTLNDEAREASMADEGGVSAAIVERQEPSEEDFAVSPRRVFWSSLAIGTALGCAAGLWLYAKGRSS